MIKIYKTGKLFNEMMFTQVKLIFLVNYTYKIIIAVQNVLKKTFHVEIVVRKQFEHFVPFTVKINYWH